MADSTQAPRAADEPAILVVDDRPANIVAFLAVLEPLGQPVVTATTGQEALRHLLQRDFALMLIDVQMPGMDGFELARSIKSHPRLAAIPIIFVTALSRDATHVFDGYAHGAVDYLLKPFEPAMLRAKVRVFAELYRAQRTVRQLEREQRAREQAEAANRMKDEFLATVSHELRTPLNAILSWARLVRTGALDAARLSKAIDTIERNAQAQARLVDDLLDVSRVVCGKLLLHVGPLDLRAVVGEAIDMLRPAAEAKGVAIHWSEDGSRIPMVGDALRLRQVVCNLVANAVKFTPSEGRIDVRADAQDGYSRVVVEDTGRGIGADFLPNLFDRFRQEAPPKGREPEGLGIGLSIVKHLVELHGGSVVAESEGPGRGARFTVVVPTDAGAARSGAPGRSGAASPSAST